MAIVKGTEVIIMDNSKLAGVVGFFDNPGALIEATKKVRAANVASFDCYTPYPIHGLDKVQGLKRSPLPFVTLGAGLTGFMCACALQYWTSAVDWPLNVGGKPLWSWPAFVPIMFELTVLFAGLATVGAMFLINGLPNTKKRAFDPNITRDRFAIMIDAPVDVSQAQSLLKSCGATDVKSVETQGWFT